MCWVRSVRQALLVLFLLPLALIPQLPLWPLDLPDLRAGVGKTVPLVVELGDDPFLSGPPGRLATAPDKGQWLESQVSRGWYQALKAQISLASQLASFFF